MWSVISNRSNFHSSKILYSNWSLTASAPVSLRYATTVQTNENSTFSPNIRSAITESIYGPAEPRYKHRFKNKPVVTYSRAKLQGTQRAMALIKALEKAKKEARENELVTIDLKKINDIEKKKYIVKTMSYVPTEMSQGVPENAELIAPLATEENFSSSSTTQANSSSTPTEKEPSKKEPVLLLANVNPKTSIVDVFRLWASAPITFFFDTRLSLSLLSRKFGKEYEFNVNDILHLRRSKRDLAKIIFSAVCLYYYPPSLLIATILPFTQPTWLPSMFISTNRKVKMEIQMEKKRKMLAPLIVKDFEKHISTLSPISESLQNVFYQKTLKNILNNYTTKNQAPAYSDVEILTPWFSSTFTVARLTYSEAKRIASFLGISMPFLFPRSRILSRFTTIAHEDMLLRVSPVRSEEYFELCKSRQIPVSNDPKATQEALKHHARFMASLNTPAAVMNWVFARALGSQKYHDN